MRINQAYVSPALEFFKKDLLAYYDLKEYSDPNKPAFFLGMYSMQDLNALYKHKGFSLLMFGSQRDFDFEVAIRADALISVGWMQSKLNPKYHNHKELYIALKDYSDYKLTPLGDRVYIYNGLHGNKKEYYNYGLTAKIPNTLSCYGKTKKQLLTQVYPNTYCYFKPRISGGNTTKWELMLMGRECIEGVVDLNTALERIEKAKGNNPQYIRDIALETLTMDDKWLYTSYW